MSRPSEEIRGLATITIHTLICVLTMVLSLTGNSLICLAFYRNRTLRTITNFYVLAMAITDIIFAVFVLPFNTVSSGVRKWPFSFTFCQFRGFITFIWGLVSMGILALTAVNRYFCVVKSNFYPTLFTKRKTVTSVIFVWLFTVSFFSTATFVTPVSLQWHPYYVFCQATGIDVRKSNALVFSIVGVFFAPSMSIILFCYGSVYRAIRRHNSAVIPSIQAANLQIDVSAHEIQASRVLLTAVMAFCVCWTPFIIVTTLEMAVRVTIPSFWQSFSTMVSVGSTWINPIIYGVMNRAMRREFLKLLRCRKKT